jgi:hypothetical protein
MVTLVELRYGVAALPDGTLEMAYLPPWNNIL